MLVKESRKLLDDVDRHIAYCPSCGEIIDKIFTPGEFVLVATPGTRPYFGRILRLKHEYDKKDPVVIVSAGGQQTEQVDLAYIEKVGD